MSREMTVVMEDDIFLKLQMALSLTNEDTDESYNVTVPEGVSFDSEEFLEYFKEN